MKKFFSIVLLSVLFSSVSFAQNAYVSASYGFETNLNSGNHLNSPLSVQVGYFFDASQALEIDYSHGFQKDGMFYNRIGANYMYEFQILHCETSPYFKLGAAYKNYDFRGGYNVGVCDLKFGLGFHHYINSNISINLGIDFTNGFGEDVDFLWRNTNMIMNIGLSYNF